MNQVSLQQKSSNKNSTPYQIERKFFLVNQEQGPCNCIGQNYLSKNLVAAGYEATDKKYSRLLIWDLSTEVEYENHK